MEGCAVDTVSRIPRVPRGGVKGIIQSESKQLEVTKSLLNLLENAIVVGSIPVSATQRAFFDANTVLILNLLSKRKSLTWKKAALAKNIALVINIAALCPTVAGSSLPKTASTSSSNDSQPPLPQDPK